MYFYPNYFGQCPSCGRCPNCGGGLRQGWQGWQGLGGYAQQSNTMGNQQTNGAANQYQNAAYGVTGQPGAVGSGGIS